MELEAALGRGLGRPVLSRRGPKKVDDEALREADALPEVEAGALPADEEGKAALGLVGAEADLLWAFSYPLVVAR